MPETSFHARDYPFVMYYRILLDSVEMILLILFFYIKREMMQPVYINHIVLFTRILLPENPLFVRQ